MSWGPSHQQAGKRRSRYSRRGVALAWIVVLFLVRHDQTLTALLYLLALVMLVVIIVRWVNRRHPMAWVAKLDTRVRRRGRTSSPVEALEQAQASGGGVHLGIDAQGHERRGRAERAVLVLGPPRAGKTTSVIVPSLLCHSGAVVSTSTKPDVMDATRHARGRLGRVWQFDPTGTNPVPDGVTALRWSPVLCAAEWDGALLMARAMVTGANVGTGVSDQSHWTRRAQALLAPLLHAAAVAGREIEDVVDWVSRHELDEPGALLTEHQATKLAISPLVGLQNTEGRERSSIFSAAANAVDGYQSTAALAAASQPNFFANRFVNSQDTIYIHAPAEQQHLVAPLVCGLLSEIRRATYDQHRHGSLRRPVLFALDEVANIAPLTELPQIASEGASQGLLLLAALQDLSQARARWGTAAEGFLTLFGTKLLFGGIADEKTLDTISSALGEYDRQVVSHTRSSQSLLATTLTKSPIAGPTTTRSTQRTRVLTAGDIARIPRGKALHLDGVSWELVTLTPAYATEPWRTLTTPTA